MSKEPKPQVDEPKAEQTGEERLLAAIGKLEIKLKQLGKEHLLQ